MAGTEWLFDGNDLVASIFEILHRAELLSRRSYLDVLEVKLHNLYIGKRVARSYGKVVQR